MALQDRLNQNTSAPTDTSSSSVMSTPAVANKDFPMILNKKVKKNKPKVRPDKFSSGGYNYSVGELASPGLAAITSAAEELSPNTDDQKRKAKPPLIHTCGNSPEGVSLRLVALPIHEKIKMIYR